METYKLKRVGEALYENSNMAPYGGWRSKYINWCHVAAPLKCGTVQQLNQFDYCRESLAGRVYDQLTQGYQNYKIKIDRLRIAAKIEFRSLVRGRWDRARENFGKSMEAGMHIINTFEREYGWKPETVMHRLVPFSDPDIEDMEIRMFDAHPNWVRSSHMMSLFTLIFRVAQHSMFRTKAFLNADIEDIMEKIDKFATSTKFDDRITVRKTMRYWVPLLTHFYKVFKGLPATRNFNRITLGKQRGRHTYFDGAREGMELLCLGAARDKVINKRFNKEVKRVVMRRMDDGGDSS
jgi:hypothetical protein